MQKYRVSLDPERMIITPNYWPADRFPEPGYSITVAAPNAEQAMGRVAHEFGVSRTVLRAEQA